MFLILLDETERPEGAGVEGIRFPQLESSTDKVFFPSNSSLLGENPWHISQ